MYTRLIFLALAIVTFVMIPVYADEAYNEQRCHYIVDRSNVYRGQHSQPPLDKQIICDCVKAKVESKSDHLTNEQAYLRCKQELDSAVSPKGSA